MGFAVLGTCRVTPGFPLYFYLSQNVQFPMVHGDAPDTYANKTMSDNDTKINNSPTAFFSVDAQNKRIQASKRDLHKNEHRSKPNYFTLLSAFYTASVWPLP
uniref:Uncharacterized protein n=1 Tax=Romanomermis culicivorax TaxID=13658 RepID=A0A915ILQ3_ROMCU